MIDSKGFAGLVPGFDFLEQLVKNAGAALPGMGQWIAPTLNPQELEKRIDELKTVQFWLEQNARMLGATIQALEVQRMTLSTLKNMNVQMGDLREAMTLRMPADTPPPAAAQSDADADGDAKGSTATPSVPGIVDPMQWWGALTQQFTQLAASALKEAGAVPAAAMAAGDAVAQGAAAAAKTATKTATQAPAGKPAAKPVPRRPSAAPAAGKPST
jgi:hypothetical protein